MPRCALTGCAPGRRGPAVLQPARAGQAAVAEDQGRLLHAGPQPHRCGTAAMRHASCIHRLPQPHELHLLGTTLSPWVRHLRPLEHSQRWLCLCTGDYWGWYGSRFYHHTGLVSLWCGPLHPLCLQGLPARPWGLTGLQLSTSWLARHADSTLEALHLSKFWEPERANASPGLLAEG